MALKNARDHWAFLEEIEAPMWVDLTLEAMSNYQDINDGWFHTSHVFHQCSSHQLKAAFAHSGEGSISSDIDMKQPSSPKLPHSVSRSRGKHYASNKCGGNGRNLALNKQHPVKVLSGKSSWVNSGSGVSNTSTITSEGGEKPQQRNMEVSNRAFGYSSGLLSAMRVSLRKSCVTRQASRVYFNNNRRQSRGCLSLSGKSSVGSSSNPSFDVNSPTFALMQHREGTPDSRNAANMTRATKNKVKDSNVFTASNVHVKGGNCNARKGRTFSKSAHREVAKSKVQNQTRHVKALLPHRVNEPGLLSGAAKAKEKVTMGGHNRLLASGNENAKGRVPMSQKCSRGDIATGIMDRVQKEGKQSVPQKCDRTRLVGPKMTILFGCAFRSEAQHLKRSLDDYIQFSRQCINLQKSDITFSGNMPDSVKQGVEYVLHIPNSGMLSKYLGSPFSSGRSKSQALNFLKDSIRAKLFSWKAKFLTMAGLEILIKVVIQAIPSYIMSVFNLPNGLIRNLH
ncbi:hypothetical protein GH714_009080 [Hevea brasiliensis]|uniref:Uncharacterized protein n=1 Tax=Hevea brasiliensis TaxID=3981 RepID=A0A6A6KDE3_HEVBR|nr:hypothetical protein GH714_009080 [Hevea brasiliensis]